MDDKHRPEDIHVTGSPAPGTGAQHAERLTPYNAMIVQAHEVPSAYCILAAVANWLFLAGFVVFPGTFTTISQATALGDSQAGRIVQHAVQNAPLLVVGSLCCFFGGVGIGWIGWSQKHNSIWLSDRIFLPSLLNSVVALLMSLINVYTAQEGSWSMTAIVTTGIVGAWALAMALLLALHELWFLKNLRQMS
ncbi:hypothetical protein LCI18_003380 [Fusarium solani-melongenae]|uniref:Uncharacterized protein n=1 Tax=Fusarium solani subsp. cucurbitae TaxID=2747967 RepID=A0ACD3YU25_FUSSC|nr:hypothetical protein LCI18_003380 [Fusarium solani-melongenae]